MRGRIEEGTYRKKRGEKHRGTYRAASAGKRNQREYQGA
jgi:hypothetical protein